MSSRVSVKVSSGIFLVRLAVGVRETLLLPEVLRVVEFSSPKVKLRLFFSGRATFKDGPREKTAESGVWELPFLTVMLPVERVMVGLVSSRS